MTDVIIIMGSKSDMPHVDKITAALRENYAAYRQLLSAGLFTEYRYQNSPNEQHYSNDW